MKNRQHLKVFLGVKPDHDALDALEQWESMFRWADGAQWVNSGHYHMPLHQIGTVAPANLQELKRELEVETEPYDVELTEAVIYNDGRAVMQSKTTPAALQELHASLASRLKKLGRLKSTAGIQPHVVLRYKALGSELPDLPSRPINWLANSYDIIAELGANRLALVQRYEATRPRRADEGGRPKALAVTGDEWRKAANDAGSFLRAGVLCGSDRPLPEGGVTFELLPAIVNLALAAELAIKAALMFHNKEFTKGHDLGALMLSLPLTVQNSVVARLGMPRDALFFSLYQCYARSTFIDWRYAAFDTPLSTADLGLLKRFTLAVLDDLGVNARGVIFEGFAEANKK